MKKFSLIQIKKIFSRVGIPIIIGTIFTAVLFWTIGEIEPVQALHKQSIESTLITNGDTISIGVAVVLSGPAEALGWRQLNSIELAVKEVNSSGGIEIGGKSYEIALIAEDSQCDSTQAIAAANSLVNAGVKAVIGHTCSGPSIAA